MQYATYPHVPENHLPIAEAKKLLPKTSGIYFAWSNGFVAYVGQAANLKARIGPKHHALKPDDSLSWLEWPVDELFWAESFYIGILTPERNFGKAQKKREALASKPKPTQTKAPRRATDQESYDILRREIARNQKQLRLKHKLIESMQRRNPDEHKRSLIQQLATITATRTAYDFSDSQDR